MKDSSNTINSLPKPRILVQGILCRYCHIFLWTLFQKEKPYPLFDKTNIPIDIGLVANHLNNLTPATLKLKEMIFDYVLCVIDRNGTGR